MRPHTYNSEGVILGRRNFGEADRIISLFSKDYGKVALLAKGVRKIKSKKRGHLEVFTLIKFEATSSHVLGLMTEAELQDDFKEIRASLHKISLAYYVVEVIAKITHEQEKNVELYDLLINTLNRIKKGNRLREIRIDFITRLLVNLGFWPAGKVMQDHDKILEEVVERQIGSTRVGKKILEI